MSQEVDQLLDMLSFKRPKGSGSERQFREKFLLPLGVKEDKFGNLVLDIGSDPDVIWASHTDTVHRNEGVNRVDFDGRYITLAKKSKSSCLGADDASGVWIMMEMIHAKVPGRYIFHYGEESGGIGSRALVSETPDVAKNIKAVVSFDRMGTDSVITHQGGTRTASDAFAKSFASQLMPGYKPDATGSYTDSKEYRGIVAECTNISVGYRGQHSKFETQDVNHLIALRDKMILFDASKLVIEREPKIEAKKGWPVSSSDFGGGYTKPNRVEPFSLEDVLWTNPDAAAEVMRREGMLEQAGLTVAEFRILVRAERIQQARASLSRLPLAS